MSELLELLHHLRGRVSALEDYGGLGAVFQMLDDEGNPLENEATRYVQRGHGRKPINPGKKYRIPARVLERMVARNDQYWSQKLKSEVHFKITERDFAFATLSDTGLYRNSYLSQFFLNPPVVVDAYAGVGMDSISFLFYLYYLHDVGLKRLYIVENDDDEDRNDRLIHNIHEYMRAKEGVEPGKVFVPSGDGGGGNEIDFYLNGTEKFFLNCRSFSKNAVDTIDLLYIDPPWTLPDMPNSGPDGEATPAELLQFLYDTIFKHVIESRVHVRVVCIKTRFTWEQCRPFIGILSQHISDPNKRFVHATTIKCQPFKNVYYFHVIKTVEAEYGDWEPSSAYKKVYGLNPQLEPGSSGSGQAVARVEPGEDEGGYRRPPPGSGGRERNFYRPGKDTRA